MPPRNGQNPRRLAGEGTLEKLTTVSAEGARPVWAESLRQKDRADRVSGPLRGGWGRSCQLSGPWGLSPGRFFSRFFGQKWRKRVDGNGVPAICAAGSGQQHQQLPVQLHPGLPAHCGGPVVLHPDPLRSGALLRRGHAEGIRQPDPAGQKACQRHELLPGPGHRHRRSGGYRQHHWRLRCHPAGRAGGHLLDVDRGIPWNGNYLCRSNYGTEV